MKTLAIGSTLGVAILGLGAKLHSLTLPVRLPRRREIASLAASTLCGLMLLPACMHPARAMPSAYDEGVPQMFSAAACYALVQNTGRMIAWARWEMGAPEDRVVAQFPEYTPEWIVDLTNRWIKDAYHWQATDEQVREWAAELGDATDQSRAKELTTPQTIAIWLRRIARTCTQQRV